MEPPKIKQPFKMIVLISFNVKRKISHKAADQVYGGLARVIRPVRLKPKGKMPPPAESRRRPPPASGALSPGPLNPISRGILQKF
jgi:hypothetical protein